MKNRLCRGSQSSDSDDSEKYDSEQPASSKGTSSDDDQSPSGGTEIEGEIKKSNEIKKIQPSNLQINEEHKEKDNVIKLDPIKEQAELDIFEEEDDSNEVKDEPLVLTEEIKNGKIEDNSNEESQTLSPAVRKMVNENNIEIKSVKGSRSFY